MTKWLAIVLFTLLASPQGSFAQSTDCGNPPLFCIPMANLSELHSVERETLEKLYERLALKSDNDRSRLYNNRLANAIHQVKISADDPGVQFWVMVINPTDKKMTANFYLGRVAVDLVNYNNVGPNSAYLNCSLVSTLCAEPDHKFEYIKDISDANTHRFLHDIAKLDELTSKFSVDVGPNSIATSGFAAGVPANANPWGEYAVGLFGGNAADRVKPDVRDLLRWGLIDGKGWNEFSGHAWIGDGKCAVFAKHVTAEDKDDCHRWVLDTNKYCDDQEVAFHVWDYNSNEKVRETQTVSPGEPVSICNFDEFTK